jgi:16S rRNA (guanine527-N7)-methyltransferase
VDLARIAELLQPFLDPSRESPRQSGGPAVLVPAQLQSISTYIDLLLRWNSRVNLTSVRRPEEIVTRHFGESFFAARHLFPVPEPGPAENTLPVVQVIEAQVIDVGSGAGFPGLPIKIWASPIHLVLIESNQKKATFLREVVRALTLTNVDVFAGRAADFQRRSNSRQQSTLVGSRRSGDLVTLRAVEHFDSILPEAADLMAPSGRLAILIGQAQLDRARRLVPSIKWDQPIKLPQSSSRFLFLGRKEST